jgi:branched-chain amino acid aminotransferase
VAWNWGKYLGDEAQTKGIRVKTSSFRRADASSSLPAAKITGAYITSVLARKEAVDNGVDEALLLDTNGYIAEGSGENLFLVKRDKLYTPHTMAILPGITRSSVWEMAEHLGLKVQEKNLTRNDLYLADELFFTGTAVEVTGIREVDGRKVGKEAPGPITRRLGELFFQIAEGKSDPFKKWLTFC